MFEWSGIIVTQIQSWESNLEKEFDDRYVENKHIEVQQKKKI